MGRGNRPVEFEAYRVPRIENRERFDECLAMLCWMNFGGLSQERVRRSMELFAREVMPRFR